MREEKQRKEEAEAHKRAEEEERRRREKEEEARRKVEEEQAKRKREEEAKRMALEEEARRMAEEENARKAQKKREEEEKNKLASEPRTREDPDIELVTEEMLDDNLQETKKEKGDKYRDFYSTSSLAEEQGEDEELEDVETNGTVAEAEAGPQLNKKEKDLEKQTLEWSDSKPAVLSGVTSDIMTPTSPGEPPTPTSTPWNEQSRVHPPPMNRSLSSRSQEKREQRRRRGLEHNQRETERAACSSPGISKDQSPPKSNNQDPSKLKERSDSKELDQYTFVAWKMKDDKGGKKEAKTSPSPPPSGPVRPSSLPLQPAEPVPVRNDLGEGEGAVHLHRRAGGIKEKPEKWRARSEGEHLDSTRPHNSKQLYVLFSVHFLRSCLVILVFFKY